MRNIAVFGMGYVGCATALLLSQKKRVVGFDIDAQRVSTLKSGHSPIGDTEVTHYLKAHGSNIDFKLAEDADWGDFDTVIICTPTDFDDVSGRFDTRSVDKTVEAVIGSKQNINIVIKSTLPIGHTEFLRNKFNYGKIYFSPEFLREGYALHDNLFPERIIVGGKSTFSMTFAETLRDCSKNSCDNIILTERPGEAESIKLFSNTFIAMRVAFFNEIDTYCAHKKMDARTVIKGICSDGRIGDHYNNPSFGFGGYCLPKDTKQAKKEVSELKCPLISAVVASNSERVDAIVNSILAESPETVGLWGIAMKSGSDNSRASSILLVAAKLSYFGIQICVYDQSTDCQDLPASYIICADLDELYERSDIVISNRSDSPETEQHRPVFTRDLFGVN